MDIKERIEKAKDNLKKAEVAKTTAEVQKAAAEEQLAKIIEEITALGVTPETIQDEITRLEKEIESTLTLIESEMPKMVG